MMADLVVQSIPTVWLTLTVILVVLQLLSVRVSTVYEPGGFDTWVEL